MGKDASELVRTSEAKMDFVNGSVFFYDEDGGLRDGRLFPEELVLEILSHLSWEEILACSFVSREWRRIALDPELWYQVIKSNSLPNDPIARLKVLNGIFQIYSKSILSADSEGQSNSSSNDTNKDQNTKPELLKCKAQLNNFEQLIVRKAAELVHSSHQIGRGAVLSDELSHSPFMLPYAVLYNLNLPVPEWKSLNKREKALWFSMMQAVINQVCSAYAAERLTRKRLGSPVAYLTRLNISDKDVSREEIMSLINTLLEAIRRSKSVEYYPSRGGVDFSKLYVSKSLFWETLSLLNRHAVKIEELSPALQQLMAELLDTACSIDEMHHFQDGRGGDDDLLYFGFNWRNIGERFKRFLFGVLEYYYNHKSYRRNTENLALYFQLLRSLEVDWTELSQDNFKVMFEGLHYLIFRCKARIKDLLSAWQRYVPINFREMNVENQKEMLKIVALGVARESELSDEVYQLLQALGITSENIRAGVFQDGMVRSISYAIENQLEHHYSKPRYDTLSFEHQVLVMRVFRALNIKFEDLSEQDQSNLASDFESIFSRTSWRGYFSYNYYDILLFSEECVALRVNWNSLRIQECIAIIPRLLSLHLEQMINHQDKKPIDLLLQLGLNWPSIVRLVPKQRKTMIREIKKMINKLPSDDDKNMAYKELHRLGCTRRDISALKAFDRSADVARNGFFAAGANQPPPSYSRQITPPSSRIEPPAYSEGDDGSGSEPSPAFEKLSDLSSQISEESDNSLRPA